MSNYLQETEKAFFDEMLNANIVSRNGEILDKESYIKWLHQKEDALRSQLQEIPEPGDVYDRYRANLLYKDIDVIRAMIRRQTNPMPSAAQQKSNNREKELMNQPSLFTRALGILRRR
jgi:hypothetical protein